PSFRSTFGLHFNDRTFDDDANSSAPFFEESEGKFFIQSTLDLSPGLQIELGGEVLNSFKYDQWNGGYRGRLIKSFGNNNKLFAGIRQSAYEPASITFNNPGNIEHATYTQSRNVEVGWQYQGDLHNLTFNVYYQHMYNLTVIHSNEAKYYLVDHPIIPVGPLITDVDLNGVANQYGVEGLWNMVSKNGWRMEINQSVYKSVRGEEDEELTGGRYDGRFATHVSCAKEIIHEKNKKHRIWNFSLRGLLNGGLWEPAIDTELSGTFNQTIAVYPGNYNLQLPTYKRIDAGVSYTISTSKIRWQYRLDIQNLFSLTNIAYHYYDPFQHKVLAQEQLGIIPVLSVQASW
ncbi:MAG TPA: TonB-dependent receptor, partial [Saprospiraceae bacterium]|nr:TonB-dependent receptor [Saprospiraceae bacterium]